MENRETNRVEILKGYLEEDPKDCFSMYALALEYSKQNRNHEAIGLLKQVLNINPGYLAAYYQLGKFFEQERNFGEATSIFTKGIMVAMEQQNQKTLNELQSALDLLEE
jgi:tetratricopeptide (TPR) repeat protein